jgi:hypothetical protein
MAFQPVSRLVTLFAGLNIAAVAGSTFYLRGHLVHNYEESEARLNEIEGTLRGHIGLIEDALDRLEWQTGTKKKGFKGDPEKEPKES